MAAGGFQLNPELQSLLEAFESKHGATVEGSAIEFQQTQTQTQPQPQPLPQPDLPQPSAEATAAAAAAATAAAAAAAAAAGTLEVGQQALVPTSPCPGAVPPAGAGAAGGSLALHPAPSPLPPDPNRLDGVVIDWRESYGFVQFNDGRRAYVHNSMCGGASLLAGQAITGICVPDTKNPGKWQAQNVQRKISMTNDGRLEGKVQQWTGNFGFIQFCDGRRAFCHSSFLTGAAAGSMLSEGQNVVGSVQEDPKNPGKWQAQHVEVLPSLAPDNSGRVEGKVTQWNGTYGFIQFSDGRRAYVHCTVCNPTSLAVGQTVFGNIVQDPSNPGKWQARDVEGEPGRMDGIVTQWSDKGFGFIDFVDGRRAFVHNSALLACGGKYLSQGEAVSAVVVADQQNQGKWMAKGVILKGPPGEDCTVTEWRENGSWGFVLLDNGTSAFINSGSFGGGGNLAVGMRLRVTTKFDATKGRMIVDQVTGVAELSVQQLTEAAKLVSAAQQAAQPPTAIEPQPQPALLDAAAVAAAAAQPALAVDGARRANITEEISSLASTLGLSMPSLPTPSAAPADLSNGGVRMSGKVSEWNPTGFGFAMMDDGRRVYVHTSQCGGQHLQQGEPIVAVVVPDPRNYGKWAAQSVERLGGGLPGIPAPLVQQQQAPPSLVQQQAPPSLVQQQAPPALAQQQAPPALVQQQVPPALAQQQVPPALVQQQVPPALVQQQVPPALVQQQVPPSLVQQQAPPSFAGDFAGTSADVLAESAAKRQRLGM